MNGVWRGTVVRLAPVTIHIARLNRDLRADGSQGLGLVVGDPVIVAFVEGRTDEPYILRKG